MNVQKIFDALHEDTDNSALGIICYELESQGYEVMIDELNVSAEGFFNGDHVDLEEKRESLKFSLLKDGGWDKKFWINFSNSTIS
jgi:hypothetical protein